MRKKKCSRCKKIKYASEFYERKKGGGVLSSFCKECCSQTALLYRKKHKEQIVKYNKKYRKENKEELKLYYYKTKKRWLKLNKIRYKCILEKFPWYTTWNNAKARCNNKNCKTYKWYGNRGIKILLTFEEMGILWVRDEADKMKRASIDRKDNDGNYTFENCQFIERNENSRKSQLERWRRIKHESDKNSILRLANQR